MRRPTQILQRLADDLARPIVQIASAGLERKAAAALLNAQLLVITTAPAQVALFGFTDGQPVPCGQYEVPTAGGDALAAFIGAGFEQMLPRELQHIVATCIEKGDGQIAISFRPDRGEASGWLVARDDRFPAIALFTLVDMPAMVH